MMPSNIKFVSIFFLVFSLSFYSLKLAAGIIYALEPKKSWYGKASWYGPYFHGRKTANGEIFNKNDLTAAHKTLPFNTKVLVTNLKNNKSVIVRINDRGPFIEGRIIDLSEMAASKIDSKTQGIAHVTVQVLSTNTITLN